MSAHALRPGMPPLPFRWRSLSVDAKGYPVPFFIAIVDGVPDHRVADRAKIRRAIKGKLCHLCGQPLNGESSFVIGPMCGITRTSADPPDHLECARFAAQVCPHLSRPAAKRREANLPADGVFSDHGLKRNPGCALVWTTDKHQVIRDPSPGGGYLWRLGNPLIIDAYAQGRLATLAEVTASVDSGLPLLLEPARAEGKRAVWALEELTAEFRQLLQQAVAA